MRVAVLAVIFLIFLLIPKTAFAVTVTISNVPSSVSDQPFNFTVSVSGAGAGTNYLRMDLYKDNTTNYFGETYNGTSWYNGSDGKQYFPITISSGVTWSSSIQGKMGNPSSIEYPGSGAYKIKIRRYTSSGSLASDTQTPQDIQIAFSFPSPSPSPSPSNSSSSNFTVSNIPSEINSDQSFSPTITLSLLNSPNTIFYLKGAFKKPDSSNYFGLTKVGSSWIKNGGNFSDQHQITTDPSGNWSGTMEVQPDVLDSGYDGAGDYIFKVGRYTSSGSGPTWTNEQTIKINAKEVTTGDSLIDLSKISGGAATSAPSSKYQNADKLPDAVYSLENYRKTGSISGVNKEATPKTQIAGEKSKNPFLVTGGILIILGISSLGYIIFKKWKNI